MTDPRPWKDLPPVARLPWFLIWFRAACALAPWLCAATGLPMAIAAILIPLALISDIFDGIIARRHGVATVLLRRADGWADLAFVLSCTLFCLIFRQALLGPYMPAIIGLALYKGISTAHDFLRYGRGAAFHFWSAKLWAIPYYALLFELLIGHQPLWMIWPTIIMGVIAITEEFVAVRLIPVWMHDQPHIFAAISAWRSGAYSGRDA